MIRSSDANDRLRALTDIDATLLVEAAAGTGKTSLLAGRIVFLLASSVPPREIAAITFTEFAAGELRERVYSFLESVLAERLPVELELAFPHGPNRTQRANLEEADRRRDELTCTTIHGFCHNLLRMYAVEAAVDPGAEIIAAAQADLAFSSIFQKWLRKRLDDARPTFDPIVFFAQKDPLGAEELLRELAEFCRDHRTARCPEARMDADADSSFVESVMEFRRWFNAAPGPQKAETELKELEQLADHFRGRFVWPLAFDRLWDLAHPPRLGIMRAEAFDLRPYRRLGVWQEAAGKTEGRRLAEEAAAYYSRCTESFRELLGRLATTIISTFSTELNELRDRFEQFKQSAAVLDFDDLLYTTRQVLRTHDEVRRAAANRFPRILVDEFQDTDPIQAEIIFLLTGADGAVGSWYERRLLPGRLFMVGDPKQAIYRFRHADIATYRQARDAVERQFPVNVLRARSNFRSCAAILEHINKCFEKPLGAQESGYVALEPTRGRPAHELPCVAKVKVCNIPPRVEDVREEEARIVAEICAKLIGNITIRQSNAEIKPVSPGDIALLAPTGRDLWRYERALEDAGLPFVSQAGKNLFRRQEVQDLVALVRAIADSRDTLALGALLRGPVVGLSEQELLDIVGSLPLEKTGVGEFARLTLSTDPSVVQHPVAHKVLTVLRDLHRRAGTTVPSLIVAEAIERLNVRPVLVARGANQVSRALANIDAVLERARAYGVRGFKQFASDIDVEWSTCADHTEGVVDADGKSIEIVTIHSSKGLEWPVVIPINTASQFRPPDQFIHRRRDDTMHWVLGDIVPPSLAEAIKLEADEASQERRRLLYVACTRAMDLLVLPELPSTDGASWAREVEFKLQEVPELRVTHFSQKPIVTPPEALNDQSVEVFLEQQSNVDQSSQRIRWIHPSDGDADIVQFRTTVAPEWDQPIEPVLSAAGGKVRGIIMHKLMEELLTGALENSPVAVEQRASILGQQLVSDGPVPDAQELASTARRTLSLPDVVAFRGCLIPEMPIYGQVGSDTNRLVAGQADAVGYRDGKPCIAFDWKSDVAPERSDREKYAAQLAQYVQTLGAERGAVVYMTSGQVQWVEAMTGPR